MSIQANKLKKEAPVSTEKPAAKNPKKKKKEGTSWFKNQRFRVVAGFFLMLFGIYLAVAILSYLLTWQTDYDKINKLPFGEILSGDSIMKNHTGSLGAALSHFLVYKGFGIASFVFPFILFVGGIKLSLETSLLPLSKTIRFSGYILLWLSVSLGFILKQSYGLTGILGGAFGNIIASWLTNILGKPGLSMLLIFLLIAFTSFTMNVPYRWIIAWRVRMRTLKEEKESAEAMAAEVIKNQYKTGKYNTEEYAVEDDDEDFSDEELGDIMVNKANQKQDLPKKSPVEIDSDEEDGIPEIELTIEKPIPDKNLETFENGDNGMEHYTIDTPYDPTLDLPHYKLPPVDLLENYGTEEGNSVQEEELEANKKRIVKTLANYSIDIQKIKATIGPTVTLYEIVPAPGVRISKIKNLEDDIALSLSALGIRIIAPIPGKGTIGIEVPNQNPEIVSMRSILSSERFQSSKYELPIGIGKTISNECYVADLTKMPHLLMAGATGQGKSVGLNAIITSLLYRKHPSQLKFVLVDPKKVELTLFSKIERHYLAKLPGAEEAIITDTRMVVRTLTSLTIEMDNRYELLKDAQVRTIKEYNNKFVARKLNPNHGHRFLPYIVLVVDEFADLIMTAGKEIEAPIARLAQLARAVGIHLIIATQRPSVNIITGTIKANFPARIAFRVSSRIDSRTILDSGGADQLIGRGDMLLSTGSDLIRLQCAFIDTPEIDKLTEFIGNQRAFPEPFYLPEVAEEENESGKDFDPNDRDDLFEEAARIIVLNQQGSTSLLQRKLKLGYNRAGRIIDQLEAAGVVGHFEGSKAREVLIHSEQALEQFLKDMR
ncbi:MAG: DNA translocase FtsK 4TM domain-containing protein [Bacteroidales bacterium]|nr:DNA translocase FtsK 4TM domain-containing protein [Bacteroidales bacterium]